MFQRKLRKRMEAQFGAVPDTIYFHGDMDLIRSYYEFRRKNGMDTFLIDDTTWNDLNMDDVFRRINPRLSSSGEQYLYYELRCPAIDSETYSRRKQLIDCMESHPDLRLALQMILAKLGKNRHADLSRVFRPAEHGAKWLVIYLLLALLIPVCVTFAFFNQKLGVLLCLCAFTCNALLHENRLRKCQRDFDTVNYTVSMVFALQKIRKLKFSELDSHLQDAYQNLNRLQAVIRTGGVSKISDGGLGDLVATVFLLDLIIYEFLKTKLGHSHQEVLAVHEALGKLDAAIATASYRKSLDDFCVPELDFSAAHSFLFASGMTHPLLSRAVPNDVHAEKPILITGSNASGKSTYLKTAALCALLSQTICTATADSYTASAFRIYSSMALSDDLLAGESYYIVETKSLKRILDAANGKTPLLCTIDEVLRGTNTVERIAASSKILEEIAARGALCLAATHDIELCGLLVRQYDLFHFEEQVGDTDMIFDYKIRSGKAVSRNAINLLKLMGFDDSIVKGAHKRANDYTHNSVWT